MIDNSQSGDVLTSIAGSLRRALGGRVKRLILFGSRSRGDFAPDSDYDVLVVVDRVSPDVVRAIDGIAGDLLVRDGCIVSAFAITEETLARRRFSPFLVNAQKEGISI